MYTKSKGWRIKAPADIKFDVGSTTVMLGSASSWSPADVHSSVKERAKVARTLAL